MQRFVKMIAAGVLVMIGGAAQFALAAEPAAAQNSFLSTVAQTQMTELAAARIAVSASKNPAVKEFAYRLIYDHERMNADLARIAGKHGTALPAEPDADHARMLQAVRDAAPQTFDAAYLSQVARDHAKTAELLQSNLLNSDPELAVFSSYNLQLVRAHKGRADELMGTLTR